MKEYFFTSSIRPRILFELNLLIVRIRVWGPWPFITCAIGPLWRSSEKVKALVFYIGIKCDGTRTYRLHAVSQVGWSTNQSPVTAYEMVLTPRELIAFRIHPTATTAHWNDQGGS